ncbi:MAG: tripartite tricarboxylate transporter TctB family protein [Proteobacteria bacterium]|nr:tripartite tricarboxylate transporter TctB family protein [Pseudomonadota bacterium]MCH7956035.1 tripartite tricarboxylate transporter TctB family protein [Pseudomonadota bacterium]MCH8213030.1 tripartite tricarboxylate transporter TctB family protein [Pseudomonadota bacterium]
MRMAELVMAVVMAVFSLYLMWKSAELPIGWIPGEGPGGGAWPFWLATGMLLCCIATVYRWARRLTPESRSEDVYMDSRAFKLFLLNAGALAAMIGLFHIVGAYGAIPAFLIFYLRFMGGHSWRLTGTFAVVTPVITFLFFEIALQKTLPKGFTDPWFEPIFDFFY